jgi:5'-methylthioadenosine phosphorylase
LPSGQALAFIARHGPAHSIDPSQIPVKANIAALKWVGAEAIVVSARCVYSGVLTVHQAFSAVGSLREEIRPRDVVIPNQIIDRTKGIRPNTFFGDGIVAHAMFGE